MLKRAIMALFFVRLEVVFLDGGRRTVAAGGDRDDVNVFLVQVLEFKAVDRIRSSGHNAKIVTMFLEHLAGPFLGFDRARAQQHAKQEEYCGFANDHHQGCLSLEFGVRRVAGKMVTNKL